MPQPSGGLPVDSQFNPDLVAADIAKRYLFSLKVFAAKRLGDGVAAEDAAQETLRRVMEALREGRIRDLQALPSYTFETARHVCQQVLRERHRTLESIAPATDVDSVPSGDEDPLAALVSAERANEVRRALAALEPADRELIRMSYVDGDSAEAIAARLGLTAVNVRVRRHRILRRLATSLRVTFAAESGLGE